MTINFDDNAVIQHLIEIKQAQAIQGVKIDKIEQSIPAIVSDVSDLKDSRSKVKGAIGILSGLVGAGGIFEFLFHHGKDVAK